MLDAINHQGKFGEDYIRVLASAAGLVVYKDDIDHDGIDLGIKLPNPVRSWSRSIEVQVKTTSAPTWDGAELVFDGLNQGQFNRLAGPDYTVPRYLFVVIVPRNAEEYADLFTAGLLLRNLGYFVSLHDRAPLAHPDRNRHVKVSVPAANVLTVGSLRALIERDPAGLR
jgi:hypothetical protein